MKTKRFKMVKHGNWFVIRERLDRQLGKANSSWVTVETCSSEQEAIERLGEWNAETLDECDKTLRHVGPLCAWLS
jgi:uncharacterized protein (UPF0261 family)